MWFWLRWGCTVVFGPLFIVTRVKSNHMETIYHTAGL